MLAADEKSQMQEFLRFLKLIDTAVPKDLEPHLVLDNYVIHKTPKVTSG